MTTKVECRHRVPTGLRKLLKMFKYIFAVIYFINDGQQKQQEVKIQE